MPIPSRKAAIKHILCPTDLSNKSQRTLGLSTHLAGSVGAELTACHCSPTNWFSSTAKQLSPEGAADIKGRITDQIVSCEKPGSTLRWRASVIANSFDAARDIVNLAKETSVDLIVMKARPSVLSAFKFGSIVERVVSRAPCPVLLIPSRFLADRNPAEEGLEFQKVLFDYDFSQATDRLFHMVNAMTIELKADLHVLSVLEVPRAAVEVAVVQPSRSQLQTAIRGKLNNAIEAEGRPSSDVHTAVEWGSHADTVLRYVADHGIDLVCTTLPPPHFYLESFYSVYLGALLRGARCPILVAQSV